MPAANAACSVSPARQGATGQLNGWQAEQFCASVNERGEPTARSDRARAAALDEAVGAT